MEEDEYLPNEEKAVKRVQKDFKRADDYLRDFHKMCIDRYAHYTAPGRDSNPDKDKSFPVPFTSEQIDMFVSESMEKLWYKDEPCSIYGRNESDKGDADAKREFMKYQDDKDDLYSKTRQALMHCAICRIAPAVVNYKEDYDIKTDVREVPVTNPVTGMPVVGYDGQTPIMRPELYEKKEYTYQGATVEIVDPIDFFWTPEKRFVYDEHPFMVRSRRTMQWFKSKPYIIQENLSKLLNEERYKTIKSSVDDLLDERRSTLGMGKQDTTYEKTYEYIEWHGNIDLGDGTRLYIIGVADGDVLVRMESCKEIFDLGHPNIVVGNIGSEYGEIYGLSIVDKIHSIQHGLDSIMGMWLKNLRQSVNNMWIGDSSRMRTKKLVNDAGTFVDVMGAGNNIDGVIKRIEPEPISRDIYEGVAMLRKMGQNSSGISDIAAGVAQEGVETLGEANILSGQAAVRMKGGYLRSFEKSFIEPLYKMRNHINNRFCTDAGYLYAVLEEGMMDWRTLTPSQIKADVDFICEASARESQRSVITQQILQAVNMNVKMVDILGPVPLVLLLKKLYQEGFGWKKSDIEQLLPLDAIQAQVAQRDAMMQAEMTGENPDRMPQPTNESDAAKSASIANTPEVGRIK